MSLNVPSFIFSLSCCLLSLIISGSSANKKGREWLAGLKHPDNSFIENAMPVIGLVFYGSFGYVLYNLCVSGDIIAIALMTAVIQLNGITAFLLYKIKRLKLFLAVSVLIPVLLIMTIFRLMQINAAMIIIPALYLIWLVYDFYYFYRLMKLNE